jgi:hypothetical protein
VLIGLCVIVAVGKSSDIPDQLWTTASALGGGLLGILAPSPAPSSVADHAPAYGAAGKISRLLSILAKDLWANRSVTILLVIFAASVGFGVADNSDKLQSLAAASGAALVGLLGPAPTERKG